MNRLVLTVVFACTFMGLSAQKVENVRATASGEQIIITYDLTGTKPDQKFKVNLYSSHNNFTSPVIQVTGDVGENILAGKDKRIFWSAKSELTNFKGNLSFEVRADLMAPVVAPVTPPAVTSTDFKFRDVASVKRGSNLQVGWTGGTTTENIKLELLKENVPQQTLTSSKNSGSYSWAVPADTKPGEYQLKITGSSGTGLSSYFSIKHKVATGLKILPVVVIVGVIAATSGGGGDEDTPGGGGGSTDLPKAPDPK